MQENTRRNFLAAITGSVCLGLVPRRARAADDPPEAVMKNIVEAVKKRSYDQFLLDAGDEVRAGITKQMFEGVAGQLAPRLKNGYSTTYLGKLTQKGHAVYLWRLEPAEGKDEVLVRLAMKDKRVTGIWFQ